MTSGRIMPEDPGGHDQVSGLLSDPHYMVALYKRPRPPGSSTFLPAPCATGQTDTRSAAALLLCGRDEPELIENHFIFRMRRWCGRDS
jgi:hypothetical protein